MHCDISFRMAAILIATATATLFTLAPVGAQVAGPAATPAALPAPSSAATAPRQPSCEVLAEKARFDVPLVRTARALAAHRPVKIVALGSSSTYGAGASTSAASPEGCTPSHRKVTSVIGRRRLNFIRLAVLL